MPRYRLTIEYDGTGLVGWQRQDNGPSVQQALEEAFTAFCGESVTLSAAGRTDAGVHALGQVAHVDLDRDWPAETVRKAVNQHLRPQPISILDAAEVDEEFHARFSAVERAYLYRIISRPSPLALEQGQAWHVPRLLDAGAMHETAQVLVGHNDFSTFRDAQCQAKSPVKTLDELTVGRTGELIEVRARARSFLHRQVRSMVGSLMHVGEGKWSAADLRAALEARDRAACGVIAPACGLYLVEVGYR
ncbi:MAG: tRNA pseudouridine(38-40) synthase TruA [Rhodospirillaceae bacterium]|nr:tRNA pseudouridine(38-40) synthase TruA [Rhodospirillaceae bacterium]|tara:strand:- start:1235 stop:1975 length:741 start_codon:yes stop_codon:yes gene_type:complete